MTVQEFDMPSSNAAWYQGRMPMYGVLKMQAIFHHNRSEEISQNCRSPLKTPGARRVTRNNFHTEDTQILGITV